jgi:hypothetical protein
LGGEIQETSKKSVLKAVNDQDVIQEVCCILYKFYFKEKAIHTYINKLQITLFIG